MNNSLRDDILHHIYVTGGYTTIESLMEYLDVSKRTAWKYLEYLSKGSIKERFLKRVNEETRNPHEKIIYQVTAKTCKMYNNKDSYYRKKHPPEYIIRSLLKNGYFSFYKEVKDKCIFLSEDKLNYLLTIYPMDIIPVKYVAGEKKILSFEDTILPLENGFKIIYFDKDVTIKNQINTIYTNYASLIGVKSVPVYMHIVATNRLRLAEFLEANRAFNCRFYPSPCDIENDLIEIYAGYLKKQAEERGEDISLIAENLRNGSIKKILLEKVAAHSVKLNSKEKDVLCEMNSLSIHQILILIKTMIENKSENISEFLFSIIKLNYFGYIRFQSRRPVFSCEAFERKLS